MIIRKRKRKKSSKMHKIHGHPSRSQSMANTVPIHRGLVREIRDID